MTVDGGAWYGADGTGGDGRYQPSQEWSAAVTNANSGFPGVPPKGFNGDLTTACLNLDSHLVFFGMQRLI